MASDRQQEALWDRQSRAIFDASMDGVVAIDEQGKVVDWSRQAAALFGWSLEEALHRKFADFAISATARAAYVARFEQYRLAGRDAIIGQRLVSRAHPRDGRTVPIELSLSRFEQAEHVYFNAFVRNISAQQRDERRQRLRLREAELIGDTAVETATADSFEESLQALLDAICEQIAWPLGHVWLPDDSGRLLASSGIWHAEIVTGNFRSAVEAMRFRRGEDLPGRIWATGEPNWIDDVREHQELRRTSHFAAAGLKATFAFPVLSGQDVVAVLEFFHTKRMPRNDQLLELAGRLGLRIGAVVQARRFERQQARLAAIVGSSYDAIIGKALDGTITSWNAGAERVYGYTEDEAIGKTIGIILPDNVDSEEKEIQHAIETGQRLEQFKTVRKRKDGSRLPVSLTISPIADVSGHVVGSSSIERDISARERRDQELTAAKEVAVRANRARGEFLANVSHELRTPMNAIIGMTQIALEEDLSPVVRDYLETANDAAHSLLTLLNDILDFSRMESGKFSISSEEFSLTEVVDETVKTISNQAFAKGLELVCEMPRDLPAAVLGDPTRLRQILTNLLSNAIKFTEHGEIVLRVRPVRTWPEEIRLSFSVRDTGIGIPAEHHQEILEPFTQVDSSSIRAHGGTGLGLAICSELLRLQGGRLSLQSAPGQGSTFSFNLSFDLPSDPRPERVDGMPFEPFRNLPVLVVDDNETNRRIIADALTSWSFQPIVAQDADQAIGLYRRELEHGRMFPVVIVDALMPGMDGYELSRKLTEHDGQPALPVVLMVSSADRRDFRDREDDASVSVYLQKPVTLSALMSAMMRALNIHTPEIVAARIGEPRSASPTLSILVAEDTPANQKVVTAVLKKRGHTVTVADNGREAVDEAKKQPFDVVLMDVQMPIMDGYQATAAIRDLERSQPTPTPIIAMTAHTMRGDRERCLAAGMDAYIAKPIDVKQMLGLIESIAEDRGDVKIARDTASPREEGQDADVIDYEGAMQRLDGDQELFREFVGFYDEDSKTLGGQIEQAIREGDAERLHRAAHSLKGLAANLGATRVVEAARVLEQTGKSNSLDNAPHELARLRTEMRTLNDRLVSYRTG